MQIRYFVRKRPSYCSMASEVMEFFSLSIKPAFELPDFGTVVASEVNGSVVTA